jgi:hypothetical protein
MNIHNYREHLNKMKLNKEYRDNFNKNQLKETIQRWKEMDKMINAEDVPDIPSNINKDMWNEIFIPILIEKGAITKADLINGKWYYGNYRNSEFGKWDAKNNKFHHLRYKFGYRWDDCNHFEDDDGYALFVPLREANKEEIQEQEKIIQDGNLYTN